MGRKPLKTGDERKPENKTSKKKSSVIVRKPKREDAFREIEERIRLVIQNPIVGVAWASKTGEVIDANEAFCNLLEYKIEELKGTNFSKFTHPDDVEREWPLATQILEGKIDHYKIEKRYISKSGKTVWVELNLSYAKNTEGEFTYFIGIVVNITARKQAEQELIESKEKFRLVTENPFIGVAWATKEGLILDANEAFQSMLNYGPELKGMNIKEIIYPEDLASDKEIVHKIIKGEINNAQFNRRYISKDKKVIWCEVSVNSIRDKTGEVQYLNGIFQNITLRKEAEDALKKSETQYRFLTDIVPQIFWTSKPDGNVDFYNSKFYEYTGLTFEQAKEWGWGAIVHRDDLQKTIDAWTDSLKKGIPYDSELRLFRASDKTYRWHLGRAVPLKDSGGNIIKWFGTVTDIHEQKKIEEDLKTKNIELEKVNEDLDGFVYTASHDLKAPVSNIEGLTTALEDILSGELKEKSYVKEIIEMISNSTQKLKDTIQDLSDIGHAQRNIADDVEEISIKKLVEDIKVMLSREIETTSANIVLEVDDSPTLKFSKTDLKSILYNLILNSIRYRSPDRKPEIAIKTYRADNCIVLSVKDNGLGIPSNKIDYVFGMFKRFHTEIPGSGVGLYIVKRIVDNNKGKIEVESEVGSGSNFKIFFNTKVH